MRNGEIVRLERDGTIAVIVIDNPPVNASSIEVRRALLSAIHDVSADPNTDAAVIIGAGNSFIAGSDIREFGKPLEDPQLPQIIAAIGHCPKPFVAAIHGAALGGGFELALGCDARVAVPDAVVGLPEVTLGMIPGAGGTQFLPRLIGIAAAIDMICAGRRIAAHDAVGRGIIDAIVEADDFRGAAVAFARYLKGRKRRLGEESVPPGDAAGIEKAVVAALRAGRNRPPVAAAIEAIKAAATLPFSEGLTRERVVFQTLRMGSEAAALRHLFFAERQAVKIAGLEGIAPKAVSRVGIAGAGTMGTGIAMCFADAGFTVVLVDRDDHSIERGMGRIRANYDRMVASGRIGEDEARRRIAHIAPATDLTSLANCQLVVEAVFEDIDVKTKIFQDLDRILDEDAILASNTSYLDLNRLAAATRRPSRVVGLHFFSPANVMRLLEIVRGTETNPQTLATALAVAKRLRKLPVIARVGEGFIGNRIYAAYRRQCEFMLEEGAYPEDIDLALENFGFAMGPFAVADMSGLDIAWRMRQRLAATRDPKERYVEIPDRLCEAGRLGQKTGAGWYRYRAGERKGEPDPEVHAVIRAASDAKNIVRRAFSPSDICTRVLVTMVNEAALLLAEGIAARPSDVDLVMVHGYGFPSHEGGPLFWACRQKKDWLLAELEKLSAVSGHGFRKADVASLCDQMTREG
ncbi:MAG TPA: 3-hydroxyacyl-CoA dehydrogenase NAD-binding domain-containing protein [Micropepsaceae bacterium]|jgi:3-hydroxyacyl-CoA dehydrogenase|nr:3-hydroxyacyl-CoA dehydrogenase NAD-binding domain-containing protein [Micropepsaceae bacterium]